MQSDEVIWSVINQQFCSYKVKYVVFFWVLVLFLESWRGISIRLGYLFPVPPLGSSVSNYICYYFWVYFPTSFVSFCWNVGYEFLPLLLFELGNMNDSLEK